MKVSNSERESTDGAESIGQSIVNPRARCGGTSGALPLHGLATMASCLFWSLCGCVIIRPFLLLLAVFCSTSPTSTLALLLSHANCCSFCKVNVLQHGCGAACVRVGGWSRESRWGCWIVRMMDDVASARTTRLEPIRNGKFTWGLYTNTLLDSHTQVC